MVDTTPDRYVVMIGGRCYGKYRTLEAAKEKEAQVYNSRQTPKPKKVWRSPPPWFKSKKLRRSDGTDRSR